MLTSTPVSCLDAACSFPDSLSPPAEADGTELHCSSPIGINGTGPAQQAKHVQHRPSAVAKVQLPGATGRLQGPCMAEDRMASAPPQQSRRRWQLNASAQVSEVVNIIVSFDENKSLLLDMWFERSILLLHVTATCTQILL